MSQRRIKYEKFLMPALTFSAACHLLAALVPAGAVDFFIRRETRPQRSVRFEVVELREEPLRAIPAGKLLKIPAPVFTVACPPPVPRIRENAGRELSTVDIGPAHPMPPSRFENVPAAPAIPEIDPDSAANMQHYLSGVLARIEQARRYPESARRMRQQGSVQVSFAIGRDGELHQPARLVAPSPFGSLNRAACNSVQRSTPFPPLPSCIHSDTLDVTVRIVFQLR
jgi:TonB family protein